MKIKSFVIFSLFVCLSTPLAAASGVVVGPASLDIVIPPIYHFWASYVDDYLEVRRDERLWYATSERYPDDRLKHIVSSEGPTILKLSLKNSECFAWRLVASFAWAGDEGYEQRKTFKPSSGGWWEHCGWVWSGRFVIPGFMGSSYFIKSRNSGAATLYLDNFHHTWGGAWWRNHGGDNQKWYAVADPEYRGHPGYYRICAKNDLRCLEKDGSNVRMSGTPSANNCTSDDCYWRFNTRGELEPFGAAGSCVRASSGSVLEVAKSPPCTTWEFVEAE